MSSQEHNMAVLGQIVKHIPAKLIEKLKAKHKIQTRSSPKTRRCSRQGDSTSCYRTLPRWGTMCAGVLSAADISDIRPNETASGYWGEHHRDHGRVFDAGQQPGCDYAKLLWSDAELGPLEDADKARLLVHGLASGAPDGVAGRVESARAIGNGQIPAVAALAWGVLTGDIKQAATAAADETAVALDAA